MSNTASRSPQSRNGKSHKQRIGIIGGTGFSQGLEDIVQSRSVEHVVETSFGDVSLLSLPFEDSGEIVYVPRHGLGHATPPHRINHHAHVKALEEYGVRYVLATSAVGSLHSYLRSGDLVILDDFIDLRGGSPTTFYDGSDNVVRHTDFSEPFCQHLRGLLLEEANQIVEAFREPPAVHATGVYLCLSGPRYETPAEVKLFAKWGADVVGMTIAPEAILAREAGLCYAAVAVVTNIATGLSGTLVSHGDVEAQMAASRLNVLSLLLATIRRLLASHT